MVREEWQWVLASVLGLVFGIGLWKVFPDPLGSGKPVTFHQFMHYLICDQTAHTNMNAPFEET
jgi:hypothetical protein